MTGPEHRARGATAGGRATAAGRPPLIAEVAVVAFLLVAYDRVAALVGVHVSQAVERGQALLRVEGDLGVDAEVALDHALAAHRVLGQAASLYYDLAHGSVTIAVLALLYAGSTATYRRARRALVGVNLAALVAFWLLPVAPPRLLVGSGFVDVVARSGTWGSWEGSVALSHHTDAYAATPSLHAAWATWVLLATAAATRRWWLRALAAAHLALTVLVVLSTGNHYVVDVVAGAALALAVWAVADAPRRLPVPARCRSRLDPVR